MGETTGSDRIQVRLEGERRTRVVKKAATAQKKLIEQARRRVPEGVQEGQGLFFLMLFQLAGESIEADVDTFCDRAEATFEEIEAFGQEPQLDEDWLGEVTGDRDTFNFSTDNLVSDLVSPPRKGRRKKQLSQEEQDRLREEVENAIIDETERGGEQNYEQAISGAHSENVTEWIEKIRVALQESETGILEFWSMREGTRLKAAEVLLGLLLGQENWTIGQDRFYEEVTVTMDVKEEQA